MVAVIPLITRASILSFIMGREPESQQQTQRKGNARCRVPPACQYCQRLFSRKEHLQRHLLTHTQEKPYKCQICPKAFGRRDLLVRHNRMIHSSTPRVATREDGVGLRSRSSPSMGVASKAATPANASVARTRAESEGPTPMQLSVEDQQSHLTAEPQDGPFAQTRDDVFDDDGMVPFAWSKTLQDPIEDFNLFLESIGLSQNWEPEVCSPTESPYLATTSSAVPSSSFRQGMETEPCPSPRLQNDDAPYSTFGSRLPSLQPEPRDSSGRNHIHMTEYLPKALSIYNLRNPGIPSLYQEAGKPQRGVTLRFRTTVPMGPFTFTGGLHRRPE